MWLIHAESVIAPSPTFPFIAARCMPCLSWTGRSGLAPLRQRVSWLHRSRQEDLATGSLASTPYPAGFTYATGIKTF